MLQDDDPGMSNIFALDTVDVPDSHFNFFPLPAFFGTLTLSHSFRFHGNLSFLVLHFSSCLLLLI